MIPVTFRGARAVLTLALLIGGIATAAPRPTLYQRLGGDSGVAAIADSLIDRVAADPRLGRSFKDADLGRIKRLLAEQICDLSAGPCRYSGDSMKETHAGHHISEAEFYGMVADLRDVLKERHVSMGATNELLRLLAPMKRDVVESAQPGPAAQAAQVPPPAQSSQTAQGAQAAPTAQAETSQ